MRQQGDQANRDEEGMTAGARGDGQGAEGARLGITRFWNTKTTKSSRKARKAGGILQAGVRRRPGRSHTRQGGPARQGIDVRTYEGGAKRGRLLRIC
jgi:hypothetical protein